MAHSFNLKVDQYLAYFEATWLGSTRNKSKKRGKPLYPVSLWNKREEVISEEELTTNCSESWNSVSKSCLPMKPSLWVVMGAFKKEDSAARAKVFQVAAGEYVEPNPSRTKCYEERKEKLAQAVNNYNNMLLKDWLNLIISFYDAYIGN